MDTYPRAGLPGWERDVSRQYPLAKDRIVGGLPGHRNEELEIYVARPRRSGAASTNNHYINRTA